MKRVWSLIWAWLAVVCLLLSLGLHALRINPEKGFEKQSVVARQTESRSFSAPRNLQALSRTSLRNRDGPRECFFASDVFLRVEDLGPVGPPWLEYRGPPGRYWDPDRVLRVARLPGTPAAHKRGADCCSDQKFSPVGGPS